MKIVAIALLLCSVVSFSGGIRGTVVDDDGKPLEGVNVSIKARMGSNQATVSTNAKGVFRRKGLQVGTYDIYFTLEGYQVAYVEVTIDTGPDYRVGNIPLAKKPEGLLNPEIHAQARAAIDTAAKATAEGNHQMALDALLQFNALLPEASPEVLLNIALSHEKLGNTKQALAHYEQTVELEPNLEAYVAIAEIHASASRWNEAKTALGKALELNPDDQIVLFNYGTYAMNSGDPAAAEGVFAKLVELKPNDGLAQYQLGMVKLSLGKNDEAAQHMEKYLELEPEGSYVSEVKNFLNALIKNDS